MSVRRVVIRQGLLVLAFAVSAARVGADPVLNFDQGGLPAGGGTLTWDGTNPLEGINILFGQITGVDTPLNNGVNLTCDACELDFTTGDFISGGPGIIPGTFEFVFGSGGSFTLTGDAVDTVLGTIAAGNLIFNGAFDGAVVTLAPGNVSVTVLGIGIDEKDADLIAFYGLGPNFQFTSTNISGTVVLDNPSDPEGGFSATVVTADLTNSQVPPRVPEPGTLLLLGSGLMGLGLFGRRRLGAKR